MKPAFLVVDKPAGITSHDVVAMARAVLGVKKVGHTGTLDPFATGVLPLALGPATRMIQFLDEDIKVYDGTIQLGWATDTGDPTGEVIRERPVPHLDKEGVRAILATFLGVRMQAPPRHSAVKVKGRPLYAYAREGKDVRAPARPVRIDAVDLLDLQPDSLRVRIQCGRGTYARVLADEIAEALGTAGHLRLLRRTRSGPFHIDGALSVVELSRAVADRDDWQAVLRPAHGAERVRWKPRQLVRQAVEPRLVEPLQALSHLPQVLVPPELRRRVASGGHPPGPPAQVQEGGHYLLVTDDQLVAVARLQDGRPQVVRGFA